MKKIITVNTLNTVEQNKFEVNVQSELDYLAEQSMKKYSWPVRMLINLIAIVSAFYFTLFLFFKWIPEFVYWINKF